MSGTLNASLTRSISSPDGRGRHGANRDFAGNIKLSRKGPREVPETAQAAARFITAIGRKIADADPEDLAELVMLGDTLTEAWSVAITGLRDSGRSDAAIARVLGTTRQAVSQRWPR